MITVGSLCSGYEGISTGLRLAGWPIDLAWVSEYDPTPNPSTGRPAPEPQPAQLVLAANHPDVPNLGDLSKVDWTQVPPVDVVTAGFPCTDVSAAGKRQGMAADRVVGPVEELPCGCFWNGHKVWCEEVSPLGWSPALGGAPGRRLAAAAALNERDRAVNPERLIKGTRSGVWSHVAQAIAVLRPSLVLIENVRALLSTPANRDADGDPDGADCDLEPDDTDLGDGAVRPLRAIGAVCGDLVDIGFDSEWATVPASAVGAPHRRERVFILAWPADAEGQRFRDVWSQVLAGMAATVVAGGVGGGSGVVDLLPTPTTSDAKPVGPAEQVQVDRMRAGEVVPSSHQRLRNRVEALLPTPGARLGDEQRGTPSSAVAADRIESGRRNLDDAVALLPTPAARDWKSGESNLMDRNARPLNEVIVNLLPTPTTSDVRGPGQHGTGGPDLRTEVSLLPTPRATDGTKGGPNQRGSSGDLMLPSAVMDLLPTPRVAAARTSAGAIRDSSSSPSLGQAVEIAAGVLPRELDSWDQAPTSWQPTGDSGRWGRYGPAIARWEAILGRPAPDPTEPGSKNQPRLSPAFVEWLMGLPAGQVTDHVERNGALKVLGNGVVPQQCAHAVRLLVARVAPEFVASAPDSSDRKGTL